MKIKVGGIYKDCAKDVYECVFISENQACLQNKYGKLFLVDESIYSTLTEIKPIHEKWIVLLPKERRSQVCDSIQEVNDLIRLYGEMILAIKKIEIEEGHFEPTPAPIIPQK